MDQLAEAGAHLVPLKIAHPPHPRDILSIRALLKTCGKGSSLIHAHSTKAGMLAAWTSRLSGVPSVYTPHSWSFDRALPASLRAGYVIYERRTARAHRLVIAVSESERHLALQHRIKEQSAIRVVYNGLPSIAVEIDRASARARLGIPTARFVACWVGRNAAQKRPQDLPLLARELDRAGISLVALGRRPGGEPRGEANRCEPGNRASGWKRSERALCRGRRVRFHVGVGRSSDRDSRGDEGWASGRCLFGRRHPGTGRGIADGLSRAARGAARARSAGELCSRSPRRCAGEWGRLGEHGNRRQFGLATMVNSTEDLYYQVLTSARRRFTAEERERMRLKSSPHSGGGAARARARDAPDARARATRTG